MHNYYSYPLPQLWMLHVPSGTGTVTRESSGDQSLAGAFLPSSQVKSWMAHPGWGFLWGSRVSDIEDCRYNSFLPEPFSQPSQVAVTVEKSWPRVSKAPHANNTELNWGAAFVYSKIPCCHFPQHTPPQFMLNHTQHTGSVHCIKKIDVWNLNNKNNIFIWELFK